MASKWSIKWCNNPIKKSIYYNLKSSLSSPIVKPINEEISRCTVLARKYKINPRVILSMRNIFLENKMVKRSGLVRSQIDKIHHKYDLLRHSVSATGAITKLSVSYDYPQLQLAKLLGLKNLEFPNFHDIYPESAEYAERYENNVVKKFKAQGIKLKTQNDLIKEQTVKYGRAIATPDLLFLDDVYIDGKLIKWLEVKSYVFSEDIFLYRKIKQQVENYEKMFGKGAILFGGSFVEGAALDDCLVLDGTLFHLK